MARAVVSTKYQVVIPRAVRDETPLEVGQVVEVIAKNGVIVLVPVRPHEELRGLIRGADLSGARDKTDRP